MLVAGYKFRPTL